MKYVIPIVLLLLGFISGPASTSAHGMPRKHCGIHQKHQTRCPKKRTDSTALIVHFVSHFSLPKTGPKEQSLTGEITIFNGNNELVTEQQTTKGKVTATVTPGPYRVTVAWLKGQAPCGEKNVTVAANEELQVNLACVMN